MIGHYKLYIILNAGLKYTQVLEYCSSEGVSWMSQSLNATFGRGIHIDNVIT